MYRGSGFLLQYDYTIHLGVVNRLFTPEFSELWGRGQEFGGGDNDEALVPTIVEVCKAVREAYSCFGQASDILVTKVILGTLDVCPHSIPTLKKDLSTRGTNTLNWTPK